MLWLFMYGNLTIFLLGQIHLHSFLSFIFLFAWIFGAVLLYKNWISKNLIMIKCILRFIENEGFS